MENFLKKVDGEYKRFAFTDDGISPRSRLGLDNGIFWNTGDESDEYGHITEDPQIRIKMMDKRMSRLIGSLNKFQMMSKLFHLVFMNLR